MMYEEIAELVVVSVIIYLFFIKEDADLMIERDPRIVLRPLNQHIHEET